MTGEVTLQTLLADGFEIRAATNIGIGPVHLFLQKGVQAYEITNLGRIGEPPNFYGQEHVRALHKE